MAQAVQKFEVVQMKDEVTITNDGTSVEACDRSKVELQVKANAMKLDKFLAENPEFAEKHHGKFIIFNDNVRIITENLESAMRFGNRAFGEATGFVVRRIGVEQEILSGLVTL